MSCHEGKRKTTEVRTCSISWGFQTFAQSTESCETMESWTGGVGDASDVDLEDVEGFGRLRRREGEEVIDVGLKERDDLWTRQEVESDPLLRFTRSQ